VAITNENRDSWAGKMSQSIATARSGSPAALGRLLQHYRDYLLRVAHDELPTGLTQKVAQSDLVQETFLQACHDFAAFSGESEWELRGWLRQILLNNLRDAERRYFTAAKRSLDRELSLQEHSDVARNVARYDQTPSGRMISAESRSSLLSALDRLTPEYRRVIELRSLEGHSFETLGKALGRSPGAARKIWLRAVVKLAEQLATHD
jgi:RNA polymerase sigma-70 factor (ECF subfamily)